MSELASSPNELADAPQAPAGQPWAEGAHHTPLVVEHLRNTRPWVLFLSVLGFIIAGFCILFVLFVAAAATMGPSSGTPVFGVVFGALFYGAVGAFYFFFALQLFNYFRAIGRVMITDSSEAVEGALNAHRVFWKMMGIATIVMIALFVVGFVGLMVASMALASAVTGSGEPFPLD